MVRILSDIDKNIKSFLFYLFIRRYKHIALTTKIIHPFIHQKFYLKLNDMLILMAE